VLPAPLLAVPLLRGYLSQQHIECESTDLNILFLRWLVEDHRILDSLLEKPLSNFKVLQKKADLTPSELCQLMDQVAYLAVTPPDLMRENFGSEVILGMTRDGSSDSWAGHMPSVINALELSGFFSHDLANKTGNILAVDGFLQRYEALKSFIDTQEVEVILQRAAASDVVGISVSFWDQQALAAFLIAEYIRRINPGVFIIFGGSGITKNIKFCQQQFVSHAAEIDAIGLYEGELTLHQLAESIVGEKDLEDVPNLLRFDRARKEFLITGYQPSPRLDDLPIPVFNLDELDIYSELIGQWLPGVRVPLLISRGCWWDKCAFCSDNQLRHPKTPAYQPRSPQKVLDDIEQMQKLFSASYFYLVTSAMPSSWGRAFAKGVLERGLKANFWTYMRATNERLSGMEYFQLLKSAGFDMVTVGVESTVDRILTSVAKGNSRSDIVNTICGLSKAGIRTKFNLIADLPPATVDDARSNWNFILENLLHINDLTVFEFELVDGTAMATHPQDYNLKIVKDKRGNAKMLVPGILQHINPFYADNESQKIIKRTKDLAIDIEFLQLTKEVRGEISTENYRWKDSIVLFRPFTAVHSRFTPFDSQPQEVYLVVLHDVFKFFIAPASFSDLINVMRRGTETTVTYSDLFNAFVSGARWLDSSIPISQISLMDRLLDRLTREGFISEINGNGSSQNDFTRDAERVDPQEDLPLSFGRYPFPDLPFTFGAFPFAGVISTKMS